jgi:hypothetical protein
MTMLMLALLAGSVPAQTIERQETSLNGTWEYVKVADLEAPPPADGWKPMEVPGQLGGYNYERAWFRRTFACDAPRDRRVKLHFGGVKWNSRVIVNGKPVGGNFGGFEPFEVDITDAVLPGANNELLVGVCDWTGIFLDRSTDLSEIKGEVRSVPRDEALSPVGGLTQNYGIWDDVKLVTHAPVYVSDLFIKPSVEKQRLTVDVTVTNESKAAVETTVMAEVERSEAADELPRFEPETLSIPAGQTKTVTLEARWAEPHLWSHLDPHLYFLKTTLSTGDVLRTRFGFREFQVRGPSFYLNGKKINLLATSWWPTPNPMTPEAIREEMKWMKYGQCVAFRTHTQPWCEEWYRIADEVGILMIPEGPVWNDDSLYRLDDPRFWDNYALALTKMVARDKNKPSVIMWSLENEFYGGRMANKTPYEDKLAEMGRIVKQADPTRPIYYESDGDPGGVADVIGIHYPHEYPTYVQWPNEADWLDKPIPLSWAFTDTPGQFVWKKDKPLYIGEFLWIPSSDPSWDTVWFGDESYRDYRKYHLLAKAESWRQQIIGYRRHEVAGISPWTMIEGGPLNDENPLVQAHRYAYQPIAAFPREYDSRFFAGEAVTRTLDVFNDSFADQTLTVEWSARLGDVDVEGGRRELKMLSGAHEVVAAELRMPPAQVRVDGEYTVRVLAGGQRVFEDTHPISVFPRLGAAKVDATAGLYDPQGTTGTLLEGAVKVADLASPPGGLRVLVIGAGALQSDQQTRPVIGGTTAGVGLSDWVAGGGRAVVLEQTGWPRGMVPVQLTSQASTMTFPQAPDHPLLKGVRPEDLKYWRGDHTVTLAEPVRPINGACVPVVVSGSALGINQAPLMVVPHGRGAYIVCQMKVVRKAGEEPIAGVLLRNLLDYAAAYPTGAKKTALWCDLPETRKKLDELALQADDVTGRLEGADLSQYGLLLYASALADPIAAMVDRLVPWVEGGGNVLLHGLAPEEYDKLAQTLDAALKLAPYRGHALRAADTPTTTSGTDTGTRSGAGSGVSPLSWFTNEDLYWLGEHTGIGWSTTALAQTTATAAFERALQPEGAREFPATDMALTGGIVGKIEGDDGVFFATVGTGSLPVEFPESREYVIGVVARGTPVDGVYPIGEVRVGGRSLGSISVRSNEWATYTTFGHVEAGTHAVEIAFTNDASKPPNEDRNMYVKSLLVAPAEATDRSVFLTRPAALVSFPKGKGSFVVDEITWDVEEANGTKATRFICGLLTGLGARFVPRMGAIVEAEDMQPQPGMPYFSKGGGRVVIATNGYVETEVEVARAGRYTVELVAGGSPAEGVYPIVELSMGDRSLGQVELTTGTMKGYPLTADLAAGVQKLRVTFANDRNTAGEDRNLYVDRVVFYGPE